MTTSGIPQEPTSPPPVAPDRDELLRVARLDLLYSHIPFSTGFAAINAAILAWVQRAVVAEAILGLWVAYIVTVSALRFGWYVAYQHRATPSRSDLLWEHRFLLGAFLSGLGWGAAGFWLTPSNEPVHQLLVIFVLAGMTAGAVMALSPHLTAYFLFALPALTPITTLFFVRGTPNEVSMATMGCLFAVLATGVAIRMSSFIHASHELRYQHQLLITDLTNQVAQRQHTETMLRHTHLGLEARVQDRTEALAKANRALRAEIEERQRMAQALQESIERFNRAVQGAQEGLWDIDRTSTDWFNPNNPVYYSPRFKQLLGFTDQEFPNLMGSWASCVPHEDWENLETTLRNHLVSHIPFEVELRMIVKNGETRWFSAAGQASWDSIGAPIHMSGSLRDITERKELESQLFQAQKLEAVGRLAAGVAHDFNNLLTPILGYSELLLAQSPSGSLEGQRVGDIRRAALHGANLVRQLLAFGRKQPVTPHVLNLNREIEAHEELLRRTLGEDIQILFDLADTLVHIKIDPTQLQQVILNLAANARDAMHEGGQLTITTRSIECTAEPSISTPAGLVQLTIEDTGSGIEEGTLKHIFDPFFTTKEIGKGSGLGLSVVDGIIAQAGGKISVTSRLGEGTTFRIVFPKQVTAAIPLHPPVDIRHTGEESGTILVVEDNAAVRDFSVHALRSLGYRVLVATNGQEAVALDIQRHEAIDLLVTDVIMPGMTGPDLAQRLEACHPQLRVLYVSGHQEERWAGRAHDRPVAPLLAKPFTAEELHRKIRELLAGQQAPSKR